MNVIEKIKDSGIVGAGGAGFPTHVKVDAAAEYVVINGAECEPLLRVDQQLMETESEKLLQGLQILVDQVGAKEGIIALKKKYSSAASALDLHIVQYPNLRLHFLDNFYPAGDEQVIVYETTGRIVPEGGIPLNVGVVVCNVETVLNVQAAIEAQEPVISKYVTITGEVREKKTVRVPLGITVKEAIDLAGGTLLPDFVVINGGPMMGKLIDTEEPITKTVKGLLVLPRKHSLVQSLEKGMSRTLREAKTACMNCSLCSEVCPRGLLGHRLQPHKLMRVASYGKLCDQEQTPENAFLCCGCRLCEYVCVMNLQPWKLNGHLKDLLAEKGLKNTLHLHPDQAAPFREYKRFPVGKLITRLGLRKYDQQAPLEVSAHLFKTVTLPLRQHVGAPAEPIVKAGDAVTAGQLIAEIKEGSLGANIHASISGTVKALNQNHIVIEHSSL